MISIEVKEKIYKFSNGNKVINVTPTVFIFKDRDKEIAVQPSGLLINASLVTSELENPFIAERCEGDDNGRWIIDQIRLIDDKVIILGSSLAAGAFPMEVATPVELDKKRDSNKYDRRYNTDKFRVVE